MNMSLRMGTTARSLLAILCLGTGLGACTTQEANGTGGMGGMASGGSGGAGGSLGSATAIRSRLPRATAITPR